LSAAITEWRSLSQTNNAPFESYARFLLAHPGWPGDVQMRRAAEASLATPAVALDRGRILPPLSAADRHVLGPLRRGPDRDWRDRRRADRRT